MSSRKIPPDLACVLVPILAIFLVMLMTSSALPAGSLSGKADLSAEPIWIFDSDLDVKHIATADLDDDGLEDVIAAEYSSTYYGDPSSVFGISGLTGDTLWIYAVNDGIRSMACPSQTAHGVSPDTTT